MTKLPRNATLVGVIVLLLCVGAAAAAEVVQQGNLRVKVAGKLSPNRLPRKGVAPVSVSVEGKISTTDNTPPPQLRKLTIEVNRHGRFDYQGLPTCTPTQIQPASNSRALAACRDALVGTGRFVGSITLPGPTSYPLEGRLLVFNGRLHGDQVLLGHVFSAQPFLTSFVIVFAMTSKPQGTYGTVLTADLGKALGKKKNLIEIEMTLSRRYFYRGRRHSYVSAGCPAPKGFHTIPFPLARTAFAFAGGAKITSTLSSSCRTRG